MEYNDFKNENSNSNIPLQNNKFKIIDKTSVNILTSDGIQKLNEDKILSLRKKRNIKLDEKLKKLASSTRNDDYDINLSTILPHIQKNNLYLNYNEKKEFDCEKIGFLMQMLISNDINIFIYCLVELKQFLFTIKDRNDFISRNLLSQLNEKMFDFLLNKLISDKNSYIDPKTNTNYYDKILSILCAIINKMSTFDKLYVEIIIKYFNNLLSLANNETDKNVKDSLYTVLSKIFLVDDNDNLNELYMNFFNQIYIEINNFQEVNHELIDIQIMNKLLLPKYINIISQIMTIKNLSTIDLLKINNIINFLKEYLNENFTGTDIIKEAIHCLYNILLYFNKNSSLYSSEYINLFKNQVKYIEFDNYVLSFIFDNTKNNYELRYEIIIIIINMIQLRDSNFLNSLIENEISEQITKLQNYLLVYFSNNSNNIDKMNKSVFNAHIDLIYNLISNNELNNIINNICVENECIVNLFKFIKQNYVLNNEIKLKIIKIFDLLINSRAEFVHSVLLTEKIYDFYKEVLLSDCDNNLIGFIIKDLKIMIDRAEGIKVSSGKNIVAFYFLESGIIDVINCIKNRTDLSEDVLFLLDDLTKSVEMKDK